MTNQLTESLSTPGYERPKVLVVAGYDQSAGAGILADVKTMETWGVYAYAVCTGLTFQNEKVITGIRWFSEKEICDQIDICFQSTRFEWVKIGVGRSVVMIGAIVRHLRQHNPGIKIVLDPVIRASSGKDFWEDTDRRETGFVDRTGFESVAGRVFLLTPNWEEMGWLYPGQDVMDCCRRLSLSAGCHVYLKGGHNPEHPGTDHLWTNGTEQVLDPAMNGATFYPKHGSGCVLASSLAANLAMGYKLPVAARRSKLYVEQFLTSNKTLLGWHRPVENQSL